MAEAVAGAATILSVVGTAAQIFDGCVKGFVLLANARNLGRDAEILHAQFDWQLYRLEQWAETVHLHDPAQIDMLCDWDLVVRTLQQLDTLLNDADRLKKRYGLILTDEHSAEKGTGKDESEAKGGRFNRLFDQSGPEHNSSTAAAKVIQAKASPIKKLRWAAVDKANMKRLLEDISQFVQRLHDSLTLSLQSDIQKSVQVLLEQATKRYTDIPDLEFLRELVSDLRDQNTADKANVDDLQRSVEDRFKRQFFYAVTHGHVWDVELLLDRGVNPDAEDFCGWSALIRAADSGQLAVVRFLLSKGADPRHGTIGDRIPLHFAAENGSVDIVKILLQQPGTDVNFRDHDGQTALFKASSSGHHNCVLLLLERKELDVNAATSQGFTPLIQSIFDNQKAESKKIVQSLLKRPELDVNARETSYSQTALWMAASKDTEILRSLLERKDILIDAPGRYGETPLGRASRQSYNEALRLLLAADADVNAADKNGVSPLMHAAAEGNEEGLKLLLQQNATLVDAIDPKGQSALIRAAEAGYNNCVRVLIAHSTRLEHKDKRGLTALSAAAAAGHKIPVKLLAKAKADMNVQDLKGNTALALATVGRQESVVRFLLEAGADPEVGDDDEETPFEKARDMHLEAIVQIFKDTLKI